MNPSTVPSGCSRHMLVIVGLLAVAVGIVAVRNADGIGRMMTNMSAMRAGSEDARAIQSPSDLLDWVATHPEHASLVILDADGERLLALAPEVERPVAGLSALWVAAEWAEQAEDGRLDTTAVDPERLAVRRLPGTGTAADTVALAPAALVRRMLAGDRAAESVLIDLLGADAVAARAERYGAEPPVPFEGLLLAWQRGDTTAAAAPALARRLVRDAAFREDAVERMSKDGFPLSLDEQRVAAAHSLPRGTAAGYARLLADALGDEPGGPAAWSRFLEALAVADTAAFSDSLGRAVRFGTKGGGFPGHLAFAAWARAPMDSHGKSAVLIFEGLPLGLFYHLAQSGLDGALILQLLADVEALDQARAAVPEAKLNLPASQEL